MQSDSDRVRYRAIAGDVYDAQIISRRLDGTVDIDVIVPGCSDPVRLTRINPEKHLGEKTN